MVCNMLEYPGLDSQDFMEKHCFKIRTQEVKEGESYIQGYCKSRSEFYSSLGCIKWERERRRGREMMTEEEEKEKGREKR